ncbi:DUF6415 family natural product biosynthesis protein [Streptomyces sp. NPDC052773]|uniref:DUF6415 family natural product biosynthesis protein n=1 Tax=Streptomyces sp. NPDC052773 TaxID=3365693 RepID=UPI0037D0F08A
MPPSGTTAPLDIKTMRAAARALLAEGAELPSEDELETLTLRLRGHLMLALPVVEALADALPEDDAPRACANVAVMETALASACRRAVRCARGSRTPSGWPDPSTRCATTTRT